MAEKQTEATHYGLRLVLGGAPHNAHSVNGLPGWYWPDKATPVGGPGEPTNEQARAADRNPGCPVALVKMSKAEVEQRRREIAEFRSVARKALRSVTPETVVEQERKRAELTATTDKEA